MNELNRQKVLNYLESDYVDYTCPLRFRGYTSPKDEFDITKYSVDDMIVRTLQLAWDYASEHPENGFIECGSKRRRSSLDIWRHIKFYYPEVTIFDVMHSLYNLYRKEVYGFYCTTVWRRVYKYKTYWSSGNEELMADMSGQKNDNFDEYGLEWKEWEDI
jgi:hypothetical protein